MYEKHEYIYLVKTPDYKATTDNSDENDIIDQPIHLNIC